MVKLLLEKGADVNAQDNADLTVLGWASMRDHGHIVEVLKAHGAKGLGRGYKNRKLIDTAGTRDIELAQGLLEEGADVNARDNDGRTALMEACDAGFLDVVKLLLQKGAEVNAQDRYGWTALMEASYKGHLPVVTLLLEKKADVNARGKAGETALALASKKSHSKVVQILKAHGAKE
jgi:ankyrin repeat protein